MDVVQGGNRPLRPERYKARILYIWGMPVAARREHPPSPLGAGSPSRSCAQPSVRGPMYRRGAVALPPQVTSRQITLVRSSRDSLYGAETVLTVTAPPRALPPPAAKE